MGLYSSLIRRRFRNIAGKRYEHVIREYREFLLTKEEMVPPEINSILMPLDRFIREIPPDVYDVLSTYDARVLLVYIIDSQIFRIIRQTLNREASEEFKKKEEEQGLKLVNKISNELEDYGMRVQRRLFFGNKSEDVIKLTKDQDMLVISKAYGSEITKTSPLSPIVLKIVQHVYIPTMVY